MHYHRAELELELELMQSQTAQRLMLRAEVYARALRASQKRKRERMYGWARDAPAYFRDHATLIRVPSTPALANAPPTHQAHRAPTHTYALFQFFDSRATHARALLPAALASVPLGLH